MRWPLMTLSLSLALSLTACSGGGSGSAPTSAAAPAATTTVAPSMTPAPAPSSGQSGAQAAGKTVPAGVWQHPGQIAVQPPAGRGQGSTNTSGSTPPSSSAGSTSGSSTSGNTASSGSSAGSSSGSGSAGGALPNFGIPALPAFPANPFSNASASLFGTIPPNPSVGFSGSLFFVGEELAPGSTIRVTFGGIPIKVLLTNFHSSELLSATVNLTIAGDYRFDAIAPDGSVSAGFDLKVDPGTFPGFNGQAPDLQMLFPPTLTQGFMGTIWVMGEGFAPGATLLVEVPGQATFVAPAIFVNSNNLMWVTAAPLPGQLNITVLNPDLTTSQPLQLSVIAPQPSQGQLFPAPLLAALPGLINAPFVGSLRIYGQDFLPGALVEVTDVATGTVRSDLTAYVSSGELIWSLAYPVQGLYDVRVINPDGQATSTFSVLVQ